MQEVVGRRTSARSHRQSPVSRRLSADRWPVACCRRLPVVTLVDCPVVRLPV